MQPLFQSFVLVIPVRNAGRLIEDCLETAMAQRHPDLAIVVRDDCSSDDTARRVERCLRLDGINRIARDDAGRALVFLRGAERLYPCGSLHQVVDQLVGRPDAVVGVLDGDDHLTSPDAVATLHDVYRGDPSTWIAWSQHQTASGAPGCSRPFPATEDKLRSRMYWAASHFRTARAWLMRRVHRADLSDLRDGAPYSRFGGDAAMLFPMLEMAGRGHSRFVDEILYHYNDALVTNEAAVDGEAVHWYSYAIRERGRRYAPLRDEADPGAEPLAPAEGGDERSRA